MHAILQKSQFAVKAPQFTAKGKLQKAHGNRIVPLSLRAIAHVHHRKGMGVAEDEYARWLHAGLEKAGRGARKGLARELKLDPSQVTRMAKGEREISAAEIPVIAKFLGIDPPASIMGGRQSAVRADVRLGDQRSTHLVGVEAVIAPAVWREAGASVSKRVDVPALADPRLAGIEQYACAIEAEANHYVVCVPYFAFRQKPIANDVVHVRRTRGRTHEDTLRIVRIEGDRVRLELEGGSADALNYPHRKGEDALEIRGLVVGDHYVRQF